jgi:hypothetical protein
MTALKRKAKESKCRARVNVSANGAASLGFLEASGRK